MSPRVMIAKTKRSVYIIQCSDVLFEKYVALVFIHRFYLFNHKERAKHY